MKCFDRDDQLRTYDFDVVVLVEHNILRLQIPMHNLLRLQVRKHVDELGREKTDKIDVKFPYTQID